MKKTLLLAFVGVLFFAHTVAAETLFSKSGTVDLGHGIVVQGLAFTKTPAQISGFFNYSVVGEVTNNNAHKCESLKLKINTFDEQGTPVVKDMIVFIRNSQPQSKMAFSLNLVGARLDRVIDFELKYFGCTKDVMKAIQCGEKCVKECQKATGKPAKECLTYSHDPECAKKCVEAP